MSSGCAAYVYTFTTAPKKGGPPTHYRPTAAQFAERGATLAEIAAELKATVRTVSRWRLQYPDFKDALDRGRALRAAGQTEAQLARAAEAQRRRDQLAAANAAAKAEAEAAAREVSLALAEMLGIAKPPDDAAELASGRWRPLPDTRQPPDHSNAPGEAARRLSERRALRQRSEPAAEEPEGRDDDDGEPLPLDDPRSDW